MHEPSAIARATGGQQIRHSATSATSGHLAIWNLPLCHWIASWYELLDEDVPAASMCTWSAMSHGHGMESKAGHFRGAFNCVVAATASTDVPFSAAGTCPTAELPKRQLDRQSRSP